ncbi:unnamed protein product [Closterium sp. Yama58-4]|nr:unnamed protein product [Closterium sp. Yama58-4]
MGISSDLFPANRRSGIEPDRSRGLPLAPSKPNKQPNSKTLSTPKSVNVAKILAAARSEKDSPVPDKVKAILSTNFSEKGTNKDNTPEVVNGTGEHLAVPVLDSLAGSQLISHPEEVISTKDIQVVDGSEVEVKSCSGPTTKDIVLAFLQRVEEATLCQPDKSAELYNSLCGDFQLADQPAEKLRILVKAVNRLIHTPYATKPARNDRLYLIGTVVVVCLLLLPTMVFLFSGSEVIHDILVPT